MVVSILICLEGSDFVGDVSILAERARVLHMKKEVVANDE